MSYAPYDRSEYRPEDERHWGVMATQPAPPVVKQRAPGGWRLPAFLYVATCATTYLTGGLSFAVPVMLILTAHELGHYFQARRYGVPASLPFFIPMPPGVSPIGTMGAVIAMQPGMGNRKSLFDIAITGPIAGLIPALVFSWIGLLMSELVVLHGVPHGGGLTLGEPLLFKLLESWVFGALPANVEVQLHPMGYAGWVGIFVTARNMSPIGQLDVGHVLYALLLR